MGKNGYYLSQEQILEALIQALQPLDYVYAMWKGGAAAFDRVDEWSDIDLQLDVADDRVADAYATVEQALRRLSPIELKYEIPQPAWHGHWQAFYRLRDASPFLLLDLLIIQHSNPNKSVQPEIHGHPVVYFDKGDVVRFDPLDEGQLAETLHGRLETLRVTFNLFQVLTLKELNRGNDLEALAFYHNFTLRPLIEALRIRYCPTRYNFHTRYVHYDLPRGVVERLRLLFFVGEAEELWRKRLDAERWFKTLVEEEQVVHA